MAVVKVQVWQGWRLDSLRLACMIAGAADHWLDGVVG